MPFFLPLALLAAGTAAKAYGNSQANAARGGVLDAYGEDQEELLRQAQGVNTGLLKNFGATPVQGALARAIFDRKQMLAPIASGNGPGARLLPPPTSGSAPSGVARGYGHAAGIGKRNLQRSVDTSSNLNSLADVFAANKLKLQRANEDLSIIGNFLQGGQQILGPQLQAANEKGGLARTLGSLFSTAGSLYSLGSGLGGGIVNGAAQGAGGVAAGGAAAQQVPGFGQFLINLPLRR